MQIKVLECLLYCGRLKIEICISRFESDTIEMLSSFLLGLRRFWFMISSIQFLIGFMYTSNHSLFIYIYMILICLYLILIYVYIHKLYICISYLYIFIFI